MELQEKLETLYPSVDDEVLSVVIDSCTAFVTDYCNIEEVPSSLEGTLLTMCQESINKIGAEGFDSESAGGSSVSYLTDFSEKVYRSLKPHRRILFL